MSSAPTGDLDGFEFADLRGDAVRQRNAAAADAYKDQVLRTAVSLDDLVSDAGDGAAKTFAVDDLGLLADLFHGFSGGHEKPPSGAGKGRMLPGPFLVSRN